jgi:hypothetical protein
MLVNGKEVGHLILNGEIFDKKILGRKSKVSLNTPTFRINDTGEIGFTTWGRPFSEQICTITGWLPTKDGNFVLLDYILLNQGYDNPMAYKNQVFIKASDLNYV